MNTHQIAIKNTELKRQNQLYFRVQSEDKTHAISCTLPSLNNETASSSVSFKPM